MRVRARASIALDNLVESARYYGRGYRENRDFHPRVPGVLRALYDDLDIILGESSPYTQSACARPSIPLDTIDAIRKTADRCNTLSSVSVLLVDHVPSTFFSTGVLRCYILRSLYQLVLRTKSLPAFLFSIDMTKRWVWAAGSWCLRVIPKI